MSSHSYGPSSLAPPARAHPSAGWHAPATMTRSRLVWCGVLARSFTTKFVSNFLVNRSRSCASSQPTACELELFRAVVVNDTCAANPTCTEAAPCTMLVPRLSAAAAWVLTQLPFVFPLVACGPNSHMRHTNHRSSV